MVPPLVSNSSRLMPPVPVVDGVLRFGSFFLLLLFFPSALLSHLTFFEIRRPPLFCSSLFSARESLQQWRYVESMLALCLVQEPEGAGPWKRWRRGGRGGAMVLVSPSLLFFVIKREQGKPPRPPLPLSALCSLRQYSICSLAEEAPGSFRCSPMRLRKKDKSSKGKGRATTRATSPSGGGGGGGRRRWSLARRFSASSSVSSFGCLWSSCSVPLERG